MMMIERWKFALFVEVVMVGGECELMLENSLWLHISYDHEFLRL